MPADPEAELAEVRLAEAQAERLAAAAVADGGAAGLGGAGCRPPPARLGRRRCPATVIEQARRSVSGRPGRDRTRSCGPSCARTSTKQRTTPLEIVRRAVRFPAAVLAERSASRQLSGTRWRQGSPDDVYDLAPGAWADVDDALAEPGLTWGAAKAYVVLARRPERRGSADEQLPEVGPDAVVAFVPDLMDRSKVAGPLPGASLVPTAAKLAEAVGRATEAGGPVLVIVDLGRPGVLDAVRGLGGAEGPLHVVGFASRVDEATLDRGPGRGRRGAAAVGLLPPPRPGWPGASGSRPTGPQLDASPPPDCSDSTSIRR